MYCESKAVTSGVASIAVGPRRALRFASRLHVYLKSVSRYRTFSGLPEPRLDSVERLILGNDRGRRLPWPTSRTGVIGPARCAVAPLL
jgi:hypothetical protein